MLKSWGLTNFKSIYNADIDLAPLTVLTGTNSSGKSSFIQSILLIAQTMQNKFLDRSLVLNGDLIDLGQFDDIRSYSAPISGHKYLPISFRWKFKSNGNVGKIESLLDNANVAIATNKATAEEFFNENAEYLFDNLSEEYDFIEKEYLIQFDLEYNSFYDKDGCLEFDENRSRKGQLLPFIIGVKQKIFNSEGDDDRLSEIVAREICGKQLEEIDIFPEEKKYPILKVIDFSDRFSFEFYAQMYTRLFHFWPIRMIALCPDSLKLSKKNDKRISKNGYVSFNGNLYKACFLEFSNYFYNIKYLGPLRHHDSLYPFSKASDTKDVGLKGEYTAAVLDYYIDEKITYIPSLSIFCDIYNNNEKVEKTLNEALIDWLMYFDVANEIKAEINKLGYELKANNINIYNVGTGVSQVLPVLVTCLLAEPNSTLIFEQPELHLHPKVQSRLADFFISMAFLGKQCIIETHSEYFIDKLRLRICQSLQNNNENIKNNTKIYYFEKVNLETKIKEIKINEYGDYSEWPDGFFDEHHNNNEEILDVINKKKFNKNNDNSSGIPNE